jgi:hypothetical protein
MTGEKLIPNNDVTAESDSRKIDPSAPAGSRNSLGAESVRDSRPSTDDEVVEAMDEMGHNVTDH